MTQLTPTLSASPATKAAEPMTRDQVRSFLRAHPDFLWDNEDLLPGLVPPEADRGRGVVDFQSHLLARLRAQAQMLLSQRQEIIDTSRQNLANQARIHRACLHLLDADTFAGFLNALTQDVALLLDVDLVVLALEECDSGMAMPVDEMVRLVPQGTIAGVMGTARRVALVSGRHGDPAVFGDLGRMVQSQLMVRLDIARGGPRGVLGFASRHAQDFHPDLATDMIEFLAGIVERCLKRWLQLA